MIEVWNCVFGAGSIFHVQQYICGNPYYPEGEDEAAVRMARGGGKWWWLWLYGWSNQPSNNQRCRREFFEIYGRLIRYHRVLILPPDFPFWQCPYHGDVSLQWFGLYQVILPHNLHSGPLAERGGTGTASALHNAHYCLILFISQYLGRKIDKTV